MEKLIGREFQVEGRAEIFKLLSIKPSERFDFLLLGENEDGKLECFTYKEVEFIEKIGPKFELKNSILLNIKTDKRLICVDTYVTNISDITIHWCVCLNEEGEFESIPSTDLRTLENGYEIINS